MQTSSLLALSPLFHFTIGREIKATSGAISAANWWQRGSIESSDAGQKHHSHCLRSLSLRSFLRSHHIGAGDEGRARGDEDRRTCSMHGRDRSSTPLRPRVYVVAWWDLVRGKKESKRHGPDGWTGRSIDALSGPVLDAYVSKACITGWILYVRLLRAHRRLKKKLDIGIYHAACIKVKLTWCIMFLCE